MLSGSRLLLTSLAFTQRFTSSKRPTIASNRVIKVQPRLTNAKSSVNVYLTPARALYDYGLTPSDLDSLTPLWKRNPYSNAFVDNKSVSDKRLLLIELYRKSDVEQKAIQIWGSLEAIERQRQFRRKSVTSDQIDYMRLKKQWKDHVTKRNKDSSAINSNFVQSPPTIKRFSTVVLMAAGINGLNCISKGIAFVITGSASIFSEMIHSLADMVNQIILAYGQWKSYECPDDLHPYGFFNMTYITSLISGVGIFCFGAGLTWYHGAVCLMGTGRPESLLYGIMFLAFSMISESATLAIAVRENAASARRMGISFMDYVRLGYNPSVNVVLLEDTAAVTGVAVAGLSTWISHLTGSHIPDALGSLVIGGILAYVAFFIISSNSTALANRSIHTSQLTKIQRDLESDICVRALLDVKATDMGRQSVMFKAEVDIDGAAVTRSYLAKNDIGKMLEEAKTISGPESLEKFIIVHGEGVIDQLGVEIDRIERNIKLKYPDLRHVDLEVL